MKTLGKFRHNTEVNITIAQSEWKGGDWKSTVTSFKFSWRQTMHFEGRWQ